MYNVLITPETSIKKQYFTKIAILNFRVEKSVHQKIDDFLVKKISIKIIQSALLFGPARVCSSVGICKCLKVFQLLNNVRMSVTPVTSVTSVTSVTTVTSVSL
jgi:hypothetical protein